MDKIWLELAATASTAHGPTLRLRLVSEQHPAVQAARKATQDASEADYTQRVKRAVKQPGQVTESRQVILENMSVCACCSGQAWENVGNHKQASLLLWPPPVQC